MLHGHRARLLPAHWCHFSEGCFCGVVEGEGSLQRGNRIPVPRFSGPRRVCVPGVSSGNSSTKSFDLELTLALIR